MRQLLRIALLLALPAASFATSSCPPNEDCGPFGICVTDSSDCSTSTTGATLCAKRCSCYPGYYGDDCSFVAEICPDEVGPDSERACFNGGACYKVTELRGDGYMDSYKCDCRQAVGDAAVYAGHRCEFPGEVSCELGKDMSTYAFCVNKGLCRNKVNPGEAFEGCNCPAKFEGRHCQYELGTAPQQELVYMPPPPDPGISGGAIFAIIIVTLGILCGLFYYMWLKTRRSKKEMTGDGIVVMTYNSSGASGAAGSAAESTSAASGFKISMRSSGSSNKSNSQVPDDLKLEEVDIDASGHDQNTGSVATKSSGLVIV